MLEVKTVKSFKYKLHKGRVVVEQKTVEFEPFTSNTLEKTVRLSIWGDSGIEQLELWRIYKMAIVKRYQCCFLLLSEVTQSRLRYKLEII